jgi:hypothetical protein
MIGTGTMPQSTSRTPDHTGPAEQLLARIADGLRAARLRAGLDEKRVTELLAQQGFEITIETLLRWEECGLIHVDAACHLADAYGTTIDALAGRRASRARKPTDDLPPAPRSPW